MTNAATAKWRPMQNALGRANLTPHREFNDE